MPTNDKRTYLDLAKWKIGQTVYWVAFEGVDPGAKRVPRRHEWVFKETVHPKTMYERKMFKGIWDYKAALPKLHAVDFSMFVDLLMGGFYVRPYEITDVVRCPDTGECVYSNNFGEWIPESNLFETKEEAQAERERCKGLVRLWLEKNRE